MPDRTQYEALVQKLEDHIAHAPDFSPSEVAALREMVAAFRGWQTLGKAARWLIVTLGLIAGAVAAVSTLAGGARAALKSWLA